MVNAGDRQPCDHCVAVFADVGGVDMCGALAGCRYTVMTRTTTTQYLRMINGVGRCPHISAVTGLADAG